MDRVILYLWSCDIWAAQEVMLKEEGNEMTVNKIEEDTSSLSPLCIFSRQKSLIWDIPIWNKIPRRLPLLATPHNIEILRWKKITVWIEKTLVQGCSDVLCSDRGWNVGWKGIVSFFFFLNFSWANNNTINQRTALEKVWGLNVVNRGLKCPQSRAQEVWRHRRASSLTAARPHLPQEGSWISGVSLCVPSRAYIGFCLTTQRSRSPAYTVKINLCLFHSRHKIRRRIIPALRENVRANS